MQNKVTMLNKRVSDYSVDPPVYATDKQLVCPSYTKSIEQNHMLLKILDTTKYLVNSIQRRKVKISKQEQTHFLKDLS
jgi:hypothetical protein